MIYGRKMIEGNKSIYFTISFIMSSKAKQRHEDKKIKKMTESEIIDHKINQNCRQIKEEQHKLDGYMTNIDNQINQIVNHRIGKFVMLHSEIVSSKDNVIKRLQEEQQKIKFSQLGDNIQKLLKKIQEYEHQIQRLNSIKEMFRKESEKFKIELTIREKQLELCKRRQKELLKKIWVLEEDIKDIYYEAPFPSEIHFNSSNQKIIQFQTPKKKIISNQSDRKFYPLRLSQKGISTEPAQIDKEGRLKMQTQLEQKYTSSNIKQQSNTKNRNIGLSFQKRVSSSFKSNSPKQTSSAIKYSANNQTDKSSEIDIYEDLRINLRKASRLKEKKPYFIQQEQRTITKEDYCAICIYGPKIMREIESLVIESYGQLRQVDERSICLLHSLFKNDNAIKILEIVLFNYSGQAITHIQENKQIFLNQIAYDQPSLSISQLPKSHIKPKKFKMQKQIRRKFKTSYVNKIQEQKSARDKKEN